MVLYYYPVMGLAPPLVPPLIVARGLVHGTMVVLSLCSEELLCCTCDSHNSQ